MGMADEMNNEVKKIGRDDFKDYVYVIISTLNQMVNYVPLKHFEFKEVVNITVEVPRDKDNKKIIKYFDNDKWDKNLKSVYKDKNISDIKIDNQLFYSLTSVKNKLIKELDNGKLKCKKIFWNITGGQRHIIMAINQLAKKGDIICYLEGNNNQMILHDIVTNSINPINYSLNLKKDLTIDMALKLMGLQFNSKNEKIGEKNERTFYENFYPIYIQNKKLREYLIILNKSYPKEREKRENETKDSYEKFKKAYPNKKEKFNKIKNKAKDEIKSILSNLDQETLTKKLDRNQAFGYILEELTFYKLEELLKPMIDNKKVTLVHSLKIKNEAINNITVAEFDIALLTDNGKFIMFECKSGGMTGDTAKARNYATYAVSGVYGLPILITPILSDEEDKTLKDEILKDDYYDIYTNIKSAIGSAIRAGLEVWGLDEIEEKLKKYIEV